MGLIAVDAFQVLGAVSLLGGIVYLVRGANLPGRAGQLGYPRSDEWRAWTDKAPSGYWQAIGASLGLFGVAILLMGQGCFHHGLVVVGLLAWVGGLAMGLQTRSRFGPVPRRTARSWVVFCLSYTTVYVTVQVLFQSGALNVCQT